MAPVGIRDFMAITDYTYPIIPVKDRDWTILTAQYIREEKSLRAVNANTPGALIKYRSIPWYSEYLFRTK